MTTLEPQHDDLETCLRGLPRRLKVGAYDWTTAMEDGDSELCGSANFQTQRILLWPSNLTSPGHAVGTLLHECLHIIFENHELDKGKRKADYEERIVLSFEAGLVSLFRDNPKLMIWMKRWLGKPL